MTWPSNYLAVSCSQCDLGQREVYKNKQTNQNQQPYQPTNNKKTKQQQKNQTTKKKNPTPQNNQKKPQPKPTVGRNTQLKEKQKSRRRW